MSIENIETQIIDAKSIKFKHGLVICPCIFPNAVLPKGITEPVNTRFKLSDADFIIEGEILKSNMDIAEFRNFTQERDIIFSAEVVYNETEKIIDAHKVIFTDSKKK